MKKKLTAVLAMMSLLFAMNAAAESQLPGAIPAPDAQAAVETAEPTAEPASADTKSEEESALELTTEYRWFVSQYRYTRTRKVTYYDDVYAYNHGDYYLTPFASTVPAEYIAEDESGTYAVAPIVLDITDAMRERLYGGDYGETAMYYGQYCERIRDKDGKVGFSGIHEGIDFIYEPGAELYAILGGEVTRAGDSNGTVGVYNAEYDITLLYLHCEEIEVRRGDVVEAGDLIAVEGDKNAGKAYTHVELRKGRHTSSSPYRDVVLTSDCPYEVMQQALNVQESGRQPVTAAAVLKAQKMREEAEAAAAQAAAEAEAAAKAEQEETEPEIELIDVLPGAQEGYGFAETTPEVNVVPEATLPPSNP